MRNSKRFVLFTLGISLVVLRAGSAAQPDEASLKEMVLRQYPPALKALQSRLSTAKGTVKRSLLRKMTSGRALSINGTFKFECKRPYMARVASDAESTITKGDTEKSQQKETIMCYNRDYSFQLRREGANSKPSLISFENNVGTVSTMDKREMGQWLSVYLLCAMFSVLAQT